MLIDSTHRRWIWLTAVIGLLALGVWLVSDRLTPGGLTGGSFTGLWYGVAGSGLMVYAGMLSALRKFPSSRILGMRKNWLRGHIWLGLLSCVFILCHSGFSLGGPLEIALWIIYAGVLLTGVYGLVVQAVIPRLMTVRVPTETPVEQIPYVAQTMRKKADSIVDDLCGLYDPTASKIDNTLGAIQFATDAKLQLREFYERDVRPFLAAEVPKNSAMLNPILAEARFGKLKALPELVPFKEPLHELQMMCEERRLMDTQAKLHFWLHSWLLVHIPLSVALLVLGLAHVFSALYW